MSTPENSPGQDGSRWAPIIIPDHDIQSIGAPSPGLGAEIELDRPDESHENVALLALPHLNFTRRPLPTLDRSERGAKLHWSHELYWSNPTCDPVTITYCRTREESEVAARRLWENERLLGFDMEWKPQYYKKSADPKPKPLTIREIKENASLIQLACESEIVIFHIAAHAGNSRNELVAPSLRKLLESPAVTKTGVAIMNADGIRLQKYLGIKPRGLFELSHLYKLLEHGSKRDPGSEPSETGELPREVVKRLVALKTQVEVHLGLPLSKGKVRTSNWSRTVDLTPIQIKYAAADAYAGYMLFRVMDEKRKAMVPRPPIPAHAEQRLPIRTAAKVKKAQAIDKEDSIDKENNPPQPAQSKDVSIEVENDSDESEFETSKDVNAFKRPRIHQVDIQPPSIEGYPVIGEPAQDHTVDDFKQQEHPLLERSVRLITSHDQITSSLDSYPVPGDADPAGTNEQVYDGTDRTMRQVFSALKSLTIQLTAKLGMKVEDIAPEHILQYLAASRPESTKDIHDNTLGQCRNLIRCCELVGKDLFAFIKRYTPRVENVPKQSLHDLDGTVKPRLEDLATGSDQYQFESRGKRPLSASLQNLSLQAMEQSARVTP